MATESCATLCRRCTPYYFPKTARWELKRTTRWYELTPACAVLKPPDRGENRRREMAWCSRTGRGACRRMLSCDRPDGACRLKDGI